MADDPHTAGDQQIAAFFRQGNIMAAGMLQTSFGGALVFGPLLFQVYERPLTAAKAEMLDTGHQQVIIWEAITTASRVTPAGRFSSTVTT